MKCLNEIVVIIGREISKILKGRTLSMHFNFLFVQQIIKMNSNDEENINQNYIYINQIIYGIKL